MNTTTNELTVGTRIYNKGDMANVPKYGTIVAVPEAGYVNVDYEDGSKNYFMPVALFAGSSPRCKIVR